MNGCNVSIYNFTLIRSSHDDYWYRKALLFGFNFFMNIVQDYLFLRLTHALTTQSDTTK